MTEECVKDLRFIENELGNSYKTSIH